MNDYKFVFKTEDELQKFRIILEDEELWFKVDIKKLEIIVLSLYEKTAKYLLDITA